MGTRAAGECFQSFFEFSQTFTTSTARASSVFLSSYKNTILNQSASLFALGYFLNWVGKQFFYFHLRKNVYFKGTDAPLLIARWVKSFILNYCSVVCQ